MASKQPDGSGGEKFQAFIPGTTQSIAVATASATATNPFSPGVSVVRVAVSTDCYIRFSAAGSDSSSSYMFMPANSVEYFGVSPADGTMKISAIRSTADGLLRVTEGAVS